MKKAFERTVFSPDPERFPRFARLMDIARREGIIPAHNARPLPEQVERAALYRDYARIAGGYIDGNDLKKDKVMVLAALATPYGGLRDAIDRSGEVESFGVAALMLVESFKNGTPRSVPEPDVARAHAITVVSYHRGEMDRLRNADASRETLEEMRADVASDMDLARWNFLSHARAPRLENLCRNTMREFYNMLEARILADRLSAAPPRLDMRKAN